MACSNSKEFLMYQDDGSFPESTNECEELRIIVYCYYGCLRHCNRESCCSNCRFTDCAECHFCHFTHWFQEYISFERYLICWVCYQKLWYICNSVKSQGSWAVVFNFGATVFVIKPYVHCGNYIKNTDPVILCHHSLILRNVCIGSGIWISQVFA
jgi:hypothetical protein